MVEYIEKEAAIDAVHGEFDECLVWDTSGLETANVVENVLDTIPPADVRPVVHGKWIKLDMHKGMEQYKCSVCRSECYVPECMGEPMYGYCPNCGADMEKNKGGL